MNVIGIRRDIFQEPQPIIQATMAGVAVSVEVMVLIIMVEQVVEAVFHHTEVAFMVEVTEGVCRLVIYPTLMGSL
jgi:hypothetical protein